MLNRKKISDQMASANYKASPPFLRFPSTQQQVSILLCLALMVPFITSTSTSTTTASDSTTKGCIKAERDALLTFKAQIIHHKAHPISSWGDQNDDDCCHWAGVRCDNNTGHVFRLKLQRRRPRHYSPDDYYDLDSIWNPKCDEWDLSGNISESLIGLQHLKYLDLSNNCFLNISIPKFLGSLENLVHLGLSSSRFTGVIPHQLGNLTRLRYLNLATDSEHRYKVDDAEWLSGLSSLRYLSMDRVNFSGVDNVMQSLNKLRHLKNVSLVDCSMNNIPESLSHLNFTSLIFMDIGSNYIFDYTSIPEWLFRIPNLRELYMYNTGFTGAIPSSVGNATSLQFLDLSNNGRISGDMPRGFGNLCNLQSLHLDSTFIGKSLEEDFRDAFSGCIRRNLNVFSFEESSLQGPLPDWLGEFTNLTFLDLSYNSFNNSIPASMGKLSQLQELDLRFNTLNGSIPESLGRLSVLQSLDLANNALTGSIPESLGRLSVLQSLDLANNALIGSIPKSLGRLSKLQYLGLAYNELNGSISESLGRLSNLQTLNLRGNELNGPITESLGRLLGLQWLNLADNALNGPIPPSLGNLSGLQLLDLANNSLKGSIPKSLGRLSMLQTLRLSSNKLNGPIPKSLGRLSRLQHLDLADNGLNGSIPESLGRLLINNSFSRIIHFFLGDFGRYFFLSSNNLTGSIPNSLCNLVDLTLLDLSNNYLEGAIPNCWNNLTSLRYFILANNLLAGEVPNSLISSCRSLEVLHLSNNQLHGEFPSFLKKCTSITTLTLDHNNLSGNIPSWVGETMTSLKIMTMKKNNFSGNLPLLSNLTSLHFLDLSHNSFVGNIPQSYGNLTGMIERDLTGMIERAKRDYYVHFIIRKLLVNRLAQLEKVIIKINASTKGLELQFRATLSSLSFTKHEVILSSLLFIDLSANNLSGQIPKEIVKLVGLQNLDLSCNNLSGEIPIDIGRMQSLESLDLSRNELIGSIPPSLSTLHFLGSLNLSYNNLSGKIPYASQLTTFNDPSIYAGNLNLCGAPLSKNCTREESPSNRQVDDQEDDDDNDNPTIWFGIGLMSGFVVGFFIVMITMLFKKEWRYAYFRFMDHMYDMMYVKIVITINKIKRALAVMS